MMLRSFCIAMFAYTAAASAADTQWSLTQSTIAYHLSHPLHQSEGISHAAKGKGVCHAGQCDFLIAAPVKSFDSGDERYARSRRSAMAAAVTRVLCSVSRREAVMIASSERAPIFW